MVFERNRGNIGYSKENLESKEMSMELQIRSTLNVLRSGYLDESIQIHGLRFLVDTCSSSFFFFLSVMNRSN